METFRVIMAERKRREMDPTIALLENCVAEAKAGDDAEQYTREQLEKMLENVAKAYDTQVDTRVQALTSLLEPLMIIFMGGAVGFIAFSIMMPLIQMNDFVQ